LRVLGAVDLRDATGAEPARLLAQPKRLALFLVLALAGRGRFVRRDRLLAMFWPELDAERGRHALRQALYVLRAALGKDLIVSRGDEEVGISASALWCDAHELETLLAAGRREEALALYAGELLPCFHAPGVSPEFEHWLDAERARLRDAAAGAAWCLSADCLSRSTPEQAALWARRAGGIRPDDEAGVRRLMRLLEDAGDRLGVLREYDALERRLRDDGSSPSAETRALKARLLRQDTTQFPADPQEQRTASMPTGAALREDLPGPPLPAIGPAQAEYGSMPRRGPEPGPRRAVQLRSAVRAAVLFLLVASGVVAARGFTDASRAGDQASPLPSLQPPGTHSPVASRLFEEGLRAHYRENVRAAYRLFAAALAEDSSFALAAYYAGLSLERVGSGGPGRSPTAASLFERAQRLAADAPERDRLLITLHESRSELPRYAAVAESLASRHPAEPAGQLALGVLRFYSGDYPRAVEHARRVLALDSTVNGPACYACDALELMINAYVYADSLPAAERAARDGVRREPASARAWVHLSAVLGRVRRLDDAMAAHRRAEALEPDAVDRWRPVWMALLADDYDGAGQLVASRLRLDGATADSHWWRLIILRHQGRLTEALAAARDLERMAGLEGKLAVAQILFEGGRFREAALGFERLALEARSRLPASAGGQARHISWQLAHAATAWAAAGDTVRLAGIADSIQVIANQSAYGRDWRLPAYVRGLLWQARGLPDRAASEFRNALYSPGEGFTRTNLELARTLLQLGRAVEAVPILRSALRGPVEGSNFYATPCPRGSSRTAASRRRR
jgi:DNA-binding SARP family transcriptional activator